MINITSPNVREILETVVVKDTHFITVRVNRLVDYVREHLDQVYHVDIYRIIEEIIFLINIEDYYMDYHTLDVWDDDVGIAGLFVLLRSEMLLYREVVIKYTGNRELNHAELIPYKWVSDSILVLCHVN